MKKTLATALLGIALAASASATTSYTTTNSATTTASNAWFNGIVLTLNPTIDNSRLETSISSGSVDFSTVDSVYLDSITINIRSVQGKSVGLALTDATGTVASLSDNSVTATGNQTWTFTNTLVSTTDTLYFVYYDASEESGVSVGTTLSASQMVRAGGSTLINYENQLGVDTYYMLGNQYGTNMNANKTNYAPLLSISTSVPEPATATLSLLALAGLAARRRRK